VTWLIEHSTSHQLLWCIDSFVLRNPPLRQAAGPLAEIVPRLLTKTNQKNCIERKLLYLCKETTNVDDEI